MTAAQMDGCSLIVSTEFVPAWLSWQGVWRIGIEAGGRHKPLQLLCWRRTWLVRKVGGVGGRLTTRADGVK